MEYKFKLNLQRMAMISQALSLWEQPDIKNKTREFFIHEYIGNEDLDKKKINETQWYNIIKLVLKQLESKILPPILNIELMHVIKSIGEKIYNWYEYIYKNIEHTDRQPVVNYIEKIYWTHYGTIDEVKTLKLFWLDNPMLDIAKVYNMACKYTLEEHVNNLWEQIPKEIQDKCYEDIYKVYERQILAYWECYRDGDLPQLIRYFEVAIRNSGRTDMYYNRIYNRHHSVEENMFKLSVYEGYSKAMEYFWDKLNEEERERNIVNSVRISINRYDSYCVNGKYYKQERHVEICTFLMNQMRASHKEELFKEETIIGTVHDSFDEKSTEYKYDILRMLLSMWPWQEFFIPTLEGMWGYFEEDGYTGLEFLYLITSHIKKDYNLGYAIENSKYHRILHEVWYKIPIHLKAKIAGDDSQLNLICDLLSVWDLSSLKLIINAPEMIPRREKLIESGYTRYIKLIKEDKYELLDQFIETILYSREEKKIFKQKIDIWDYFIRGDQYDLADKLLAWQADSGEETRYLKKKVNHIRLCQDFIEEDQYELADKFLDWCFASAEEIKNCKNNFKDDKFSCDYIYELWAVRKEYVAVAREKSFKFLNWFLNSEEEISWFKKEKLINNDQLKEVLFHSFIGQNHFEIIEDFLDWCLLSQEEIQQLKQLVVGNTASNKCDYHIANDCLDTAERFVKWAFESEDKRQEFIKEFIVSDDGITSCHALIKRASNTRKYPKYSNVGKYEERPILEEKLDKFNKLIDFWIKPLKNLNEVKRKLETYVPYYREEEQIADHKIFMNLLDTLEQNHDRIEVSHIGESSSMNM